MNPIGIMQGRLSPPHGGRIQSFPVDLWRDEFWLAAQARLHCIEWIYESESAAANPLSRDAGLAEMRALSDRHAVAVWSVCADYFMHDRLVAEDGTSRAESVQVLRWLIERAGLLGCQYIVLPFVDTSSLTTPVQRRGLEVVLQEALPVAEAHRVQLHVETDLAPAELRDVLEHVNHPYLRANLDTGNSAALGHDPDSELRAIGDRLGSVHIKDRQRGGGTVPLGSGDADFPRYFGLFRSMRYSGPYILQVARSAAGGELEWARHNRDFVLARLKPPRVPEGHATRT